ncbi:subtilisin inhibitor [Basidiobolus meristosporus CBS 931.73]|uniref:Subtilisin inhibitor n=1 Tax=Basidiobolus meristosporus CBS 931.73 TaxID=1314790 RepID=A0A1Y1ZBL2_9FUNG|nr:subtilisin inhibitor [Basidiobolus meristosporus CBS 931.73]|eukprot:ORY07640.1 subtilisin inhibitor [Basidiobolus meristosporus CBS 931.73]
MKSLSIILLYPLVLEAATPPTKGPAHYTLAIYSGSSPSGQRLSQVVLDCHPMGGTHPHSAQACSALDKANGYFDKLSSNGAFCTDNFEPITATAEGNGYGHPTHFTKTYSNRCALVSESDGVFDI